MNIYPSVTQILKTYHGTISVPDSVMERAMERGTAVHGYCTNYAKGIIPMDVPDEYQSYLDSFCKWSDQFVMVTPFTEERLIDEALGFHGQPDMVVKAWDKTHILIDIKTGVFGMKLWPLQLCAYKHLLELNGQPIDRTAILLINQNPAKFLEYKTTAKDLNIFFQMLNIHRYLDLERSE